MPGIEVLLFFLGIASVVAVPLAVLLGLPLLAWNLNSFIRLKEREVELKRLQTAAIVRRGHAGMIPHYVNTDDPQALLAWLQTEAELKAIPLGH